ncbi:MAG: hypothetical protein M3046_14315 [Actinomycetota bacterium]|nr:hypothetical protein [Actinomycetota bacterium]
MAVLEITDVQDKVLDVVRTGQDAVVDAVKIVADKLPSWSDVPYTDRLPAPGQVVDRAFGYAEQVIDTQRDFARKLVDALQLDGKPASG